MRRRTALAGIVFASGLAGCSSSQPAPSSCKRVHERVSDPENYQEPLASYTYSNVSQAAQRVIEETVTTGSYALTDPDTEPEEFRYWDETTVYEVSYENETHVLVTYTGSGCER
ncbi:MAG: hypothetical protein U5K37_08870 [Natrialbaceae archaeon]|nr:hypothetical protein [Natrialbaceae archaeon]